MTILYPDACEGVNTGTYFVLSETLRSFWRWLWRWSQQTDELRPSTRYLAMKQNVDQRTIYRRLKKLREIGAISCEVIKGVLRRLVIHAPPPPVLSSRQSAAPPASRPASPDVSGVFPYIRIYAETQQTAAPRTVPAPSPVAAVVVAQVQKEIETAGVPERVAKSVSKVASTLSPTQRAAVLAEYRRQSDRVHNAAGWLRSAFVGGWAGAARCSEHRNGNVSASGNRGHGNGYNGGSNNNEPIASAAAYLTIPIPPPLPVGLPAAAGLSPRERLALAMGNSAVMGNRYGDSESPKAVIA